MATNLVTGVVSLFAYMIVEFFEHDIAGIKQMIKINPTIDYLESAIARGLKFVDMLRELMYIKKRGE